MTLAEIQRDRFTVGPHRLCLHFGDITELKGMDAFVSSDDTALSHGGGVSWSLWRAAGDTKLASAVRPMLPGTFGDLVVSTAGSLDARFVIHAITADLAGRFLRLDEALELYRKIVDRSETLDLTRVALPVLGAGLGLLTPSASALALRDTLVQRLGEDARPREFTLALLASKPEEREEMRALFAAVDRSYEEAVRLVDTSASQISTETSALMRTAHRSLAESVPATRLECARLALKATLESLARLSQSEPDNPPESLGQAVAKTLHTWKPAGLPDSTERALRRAVNARAEFDRTSSDASGGLLSAVLEAVIETNRFLLWRSRKPPIQSGEERTLSRRYGDFVLEEKLGQGGMGVVYRARHDIYGAVVVKQVGRDHKPRAEALRRFVREAKAAQKVDSPHVVRCHGLRDVAGECFMLQEYVSGGDLKALISKTGRLSTYEALRICREIALGLEAMHREGLVHRDIKPENILVTDKRRFKIADMGLVLQVGGEPLDGSTVLTRPGVAMGTPFFMAPELWRDAHSVDHRADLYAVGVLLFHLLTSSYPLVGKTASQLMRAHLSKTPKLLRSALPNASVDLEALIADLLAKDRDSRPTSAATLLARIVAIEQQTARLELSKSNRPSSAPQAREAVRPSSWPNTGTKPLPPLELQTDSGENSGPGDESFIGASIGDKLQITGLLGRGGMGVVYLARHALLNSQYAVKFLLPEFAREESFRSRFLEEARNCQRFVHPNAVALRDFGEYQGPRGRALYMALDFVEGDTLRQILDNEGPQPVRRVLEIARQLLACLSAAHQAGLVHRDIKPSNVMLEETSSVDPVAEDCPENRLNTVKVLDFGIAKALSGAAVGHRLTATGATLGTPHYMAPEQAAGDPVDARADIYAVGAVIYELLSGRVPIDAPTRQKLNHKVQFEAPVPLSTRVPEGKVTKALSFAVQECLAKDRERRPESARALWDLLRGAASAS